MIRRINANSLYLVFSESFVKTKVKIKNNGIISGDTFKRQASQHGYLPSLLGDGHKGIKIVYSEEKNILYWAY
jgi:hypothetical protein